MNEVFDIANEHDIPIYYTDTDSMHLNMKDVPRLEDKFREKHGRELNGKMLGQFHTDFNLEGAASEIYAVKSIFLGNKSYFDVLESIDAKGEKIIGYHFRLKGITEEGIRYEASKYGETCKAGGPAECGLVGLFEDLASGKEVKILMNPKDKVMMEFDKGYVYTKNKYFRKVKF
jgi:hypothetical protein